MKRLAALISLFAILFSACGQMPSPGASAASASPSLSTFGNLCPQSEIIRNISPADEWTFCDGLNNITVISNKGQKWIFFYERDFTPQHIGYTNLIHWSLEEHYLYFAPLAIVDGSRALPYNALALYRMDLLSGDVQTILPPSHTASSDHFYTLSISPTGRRLVYLFEKSIDDLAEIIILDLGTGEKRTIHPGAIADNVGWFSWSPDGTEMTYMVYDPSVDRALYFTYDMTTFQLIRSEPFNP